MRSKKEETNIMDKKKIYKPPTYECAVRRDANFGDAGASRGGICACVGCVGGGG
jgi:hypothetical protein